jgi:anti-anti-sigma regulatory factor
VVAASVMDQLRLGDHVCWAYDDDHDRLTATAEFIRGGTRAGQKLVYVTDSLSPAALDAGLVGCGIDVAGLVGAGQLDIVEANTTYLRGGTFDPDTVVGLFRSMIETAASDGYAGLRAMGDMSWALRPGVELQALHRYETAVSALLAEGRGLGLCQYDRRHFPTGTLRHLATTHPATLRRTAERDWRPLLRLRRTTDPAGLRITGEADASNLEALNAVLSRLVDESPPVGPPLEVDVARLTFADLGAARVLVAAARSTRTGLRLRGCRPALARLLVLAGADRVQHMVVEAT